MSSFGINSPTRIRFGAGVGQEIATGLPGGPGRVLLVRGASAAADAAARWLKDQDLFEVRVSGEPSVPNLAEAFAAARGTPIRAVVACGGGSVMDTGKALAFALSQGAPLDDNFDRIPAGTLARPPDIPCIAVPTTAGTGAEVTANAVIDIPTRGAKVSLRGTAITPTHAFVDPDLMAGAPRQVVLQSGLDAICQVIEAYTSRHASPFTDALSHPAIARGLRALPAVLDGGPFDEMAWVSLASGLALANGGLGAAHGLASIVGGRFDAPHGGLCGRFLGPTLRETPDLPRVREVLEIMDEALPGRGDPLDRFDAWIDDLGLGRLADWGVAPDAHGDMAALAPDTSSSRKGAAPLDPAAYIRVLRAAQ
ncbi:iron-containing alcohol dehydrogenase [Sulfitobacter albidus]|uniref:Iron-containing alcohol dehydrogenase n=1 Tax=Sulfitobacter albidus TaxID=2829501 RepID=A0A975PMF4_9RHOB|nr:iron-containing alcohol dehydrogenase [Sulfitobacter albidus]QUJ76743.1 iron-containing alcohol dehydrogenase [Sulfitobacter albidus]